MYEADNRLVENLWIRIKEEAIVGDTVVGFCYRLPDQGKKVDKISLQLEEASGSQILISMADLNGLPAAGKENMVKCKLPKFLDSFRPNFLIQILVWTARVIHSWISYSLTRKN